MILTLTFVLLLGTFESEAHDWEIGRFCPTVAPLNGLSIEKFLGPWYVIQQIDTDSKCLLFNYTRVSETSLRVTKVRQFWPLDSIGVNHTNTYTGSLDIPSADKPGFMRVKWPLNVIGKGDYIIFDTDYENYAGVYDCQKLGPYIYRQSAAILSRTPQLDDIFVERIKRRLESFNVPTKDFDAVDHTQCTLPDDAKYRVGVDGDTIKNFFSTAVDTLADAAEVVSTSVQGAAEYISNGVRQLGAGNGTKTSENYFEEVETDTIRK